MAVAHAGSSAPENRRPLEHRYGLVLGLTVLAILFSILAPDTPLGRGIAALLQGTMLLAVIATSRESYVFRRAQAAPILVLLIALAVLLLLAAVPSWVGAAGTGAAVCAVLVVLTRGVVRMIQARGVTLQAVAGALTSYLLIGLLFALIVRLLAGVLGHSYFEQVSSSKVTQSQEIYYSFTTLTTTGYGDLTPALNIGRALSVLEMLTGQIYLVAVIGLLIGNLQRSPTQTRG